MLLERLGVSDLSGPGLVEPLGSAAVSLDLWHSVLRLLTLPGPGFSGQDGVHLVAFHPWHRFLCRDLLKLLDQPAQNVTPELRMCHLASSKEDRRLHLVSVR